MSEGADDAANEILKRDLVDWLAAKRRHVVEQVAGLSEVDGRRSVLPSGWSLLAVVRHLALDVERVWLRFLMAGQDVELPVGYAGWTVPDGMSGEDVLAAYADECRLVDEAIAGLGLDAAPARWPDDFGPQRYATLREVLLHVLVETATHAGQLDVACELVDGRQRLVLDRPD